MTRYNTIDVLFLFLLINLANLLEESGVDFFMEFVVGKKDRIFAVLDDIMVPEHSS